MGVLQSLANWGSKTSVMDKANIVFSGVMGVDSFVEARREGQSFAGAAGHAILDTAMMSMMGFGGYLALEGVTSMPGFAIDAYKFQRDYRRRLGAEQKQRAFQHAQFQDTQQTFTMRQAAMAIAQRSRYNTQSAMLGNEAQYMLK